nr:MAG TPA: acid-sensing ion channel protein [Caudoviricetes sp.]
MKLLKLCKQMHFSGVFLGFMAISFVELISY